MKIYNRLLAVRAADTGHINIGTYGGHYLQTVHLSLGTLNLLAWGAMQTAPGADSRKAPAPSRPSRSATAFLRTVRPWLREGYDSGSGDGNPNDKIHATFFQVLPTPRVYARCPFFNMVNSRDMNSRDIFGELILRPGKAVAIRTDVHSLALADRH